MSLILIDRMSNHGKSCLQLLVPSIWRALCFTEFSRRVRGNPGLHQLRPNLCWHRWTVYRNCQGMFPKRMLEILNLVNLCFNLQERVPF